MKDKIRSLFDKHECSKREHGYERLYGKLLAPILDDPIDLLEIGIQYGLSLQVWLDLFPNAAVYGLDTFHRVPVEGAPVLKRRRVKYWKGDSREFRLPKDWPRGFDLIVDDGNHLPFVQRDTFNRLFPLLREGGIYVIEDCKTYHQDWSKMIATMPPETVHHDLREGSRRDSYCLEIRK